MTRFAKSLRRSSRVILLVLGVACLAPIDAALAGGSTSASDSEPPTTSDPGDQPTIRVGRALDFEGRPVFTGRTNFSGSARVATVSMSPIFARSVRIGATGAAPTVRPLVAGAITSNFGYRRHPIYGGTRLHAGVDLAAPTGSPVLATSDGIVGMAGWAGGYGLTVRLDHNGGLETRYGHLSQLAVATGQSVNRGDVIGFVGSTGVSTGPHLHYEMRSNGVPIRPIF